MHNPGPNPNDSTQRFRVNFPLLPAPLSRPSCDIRLGSGCGGSVSTLLWSESSDWAQRSIPGSISGYETTPWGLHYSSRPTTGEVNVFSVFSVKCYIRFVWNAIYPGINPVRSFWFMKMYKRWHVQENITAHILEIDLSFESNDIRFIFINWVKSLGWNHTITARNCKQAIRSQEFVSLF